MRKQGETALLDGRHGHPSKLRGEARTFLEEYCRGAPHTPSSVIQTLLQERFDRRVSVSQINRIRAVLGVSNHSQSQEPGKKAEWQTAEKRSALAQPEWQEGAGNLLLLAAAQLSRKACPPLVPRSVSPAVYQQLYVVSC